MHRAHKLEEEQKKRKAAEEAAMNLRKEQAHLEMELQLLKQQVCTLRPKIVAGNLLQAS